MPETDRDGKTARDIKNEVTLSINTEKRNKVKVIHDGLPEKIKQLVKQGCDKGASSWRNSILLKDQNLYLNKQEFREALRLRYYEPLHSLLTFYPCGKRFDEMHTMNCKKGGFVTSRHDNIRDFLATCLDKTYDVQTELQCYQ